MNSNRIFYEKHRCGCFFVVVSIGKVYNNLMSTYSKLLFIINPRAGVRKKDSALSDIILTFSDYGYETIVCFTRESGDAVRLVAEHVDDEIDRIVCMGGDGTLNEVIAGCREISWDKPLGYIPAGSTNDFASSLGLPSDPVEAAERVMTGQVHPLDIGTFNGRYFVYTASCGIFTKASYETPQRYKNLIGHFAYLLEGMKDLTSLHSFHMRISMEGHVYEDNYMFVAICNTFSLGGVMTLDNSKVDLGDGFFEILMISRPHDLLQLRSIVQALLEQNYDTPHVQFCRTDQAIITCSQSPDWSLDGEHGIGREVNRFTVIPGGIRMIY
ncbi:MAG: diacylglycerol kinase family lipid kinase [Lachnospiraceae bacterium]|nr:diacylglycerol kinase family lipid kinase [Lachnospiraceae bacterium]